MADVSITVQPTPNPNSLKFTLDRTLVQGRGQTFTTPQAAEANPLARAIFTVDGVASVFILNDFVTVTKKPEADWLQLAPRIAEAIQAHFAAQP